jgi:hypothetical protein
MHQMECHASLVGHASCELYHANDTGFQMKSHRAVQRWQTKHSNKLTQQDQPKPFSPKACENWARGAGKINLVGDNGATGQKAMDVGEGCGEKMVQAAVTQRASALCRRAARRRS